MEYILFRETAPNYRLHQLFLDIISSKHFFKNDRGSNTADLCKSTGETNRNDCGRNVILGVRNVILGVRNVILRAGILFGGRNVIFGAGMLF